MFLHTTLIPIYNVLSTILDLLRKAMSNSQHPPTHLSKTMSIPILQAVEITYRRGSAKRARLPFAPPALKLRESLTML